MSRFRRVFDAEEVQKIIELYRSGDLTVKAIAGRFGADPVRVSKMLKAAGVRVLNGRNGLPMQTDKLRV